MACVIGEDPIDAVEFLGANIVGLLGHNGETRRFGSELDNLAHIDLERLTKSVAEIWRIRKIIEYSRRDSS